jgi:multidrug efflux pump subunit AcrA (membrane-fusion protein)
VRRLGCWRAAASAWFSHTSTRIVAFGLIVVAAGVGGYWLSRPESTPPVVGVVRTTEVRIAPEVGGQLAAIKVHKGDTVRAGDVVAELSAIELTASVGQARAALAAATADRNNVYAGVRAVAKRPGSDLVGMPFPFFQSSQCQNGLISDILRAALTASARTAAASACSLLVSNPMANAFSVWFGTPLLE